MSDILDLKPWRRPEIIGIGRLPMRPRMPLYESASEALDADPTDRGATVDLNGSWEFRMFDSPEAASEAVRSMDGNGGSSRMESNWEPIEVPGNWTLQGWDKPHYTNVQMPFADTFPEPPAENPTGLYRRRFRLPPAEVGSCFAQRQVLHLGGVESVAIVWVDGLFVGVAKDTRLESEFDLTGKLGPGLDHVLVVMVVRYSDASFIEDQDQWWMSGIYRDVYIRQEPAVHLRSIRLVPELLTDNLTGIVTADLELGGMEIGDAAEQQRQHAATSARGEVLEPRWPITAALRLFDGQAKEVASSEGTFTGAPATDSRYHNGADRADRIRLSSGELSVEPWSTESPSLYTVLVELTDGEGRPIGVYRQRVGFRRVEIGNRQLLINGKPVLIRGVNRHEHHDELGKVMPRESMMRDLELLKQFNFNAVRTAHYPNHPDWYDLCDQYGIYLVDEANIESHHYYNEICRDPRYTAAFVDRVERMVARDYNHPSVISWSLGNESGYGANHDAAAGWVRRQDPSRPLHYEGAVRPEWGKGKYDFRRGESATDIIAPMYSSPEAIIAWATSEEGKNDRRPLILCEYSHAMGNSNGGLEQYIAAFKEHQGLQGGFIWDWIDQGLAKTTENGDRYWAYGGDFGDEPNDKDFCINGLVWPDRTPHPAMWEFRRLMQPAEFELTDGAFSLRGGTGPRVRLRNLQDFTSLSGAVLISSLTVNGVEVAGNRLSLPELGPAETGEFSLGLTGTQDDEINSGETILTVRLRTASATELLPADHELAWEQWFLASGKRVSPGTQDWLGLAGTPIANYLGVTKEDDPSGGNPKGLTLRLSGQVPQLFLGQGATATGPRLILWRAPTQNDLIRDMPGQENKAGYKWIDAGLNRLEEEWSCRDSGHGGIELTSVYRFRGSERGKCVVHLGEPDAEGWQPLRYEIAIPEELVDLPRVGLRFDLPGSYTDLAWYGRGPQESYPDRANGYAVALYRGSVSEQYVPYIVPQEHGGHSDTRWIGLYSEATAAGTLEVAADSGQTVHFSALRHAPEDLAAVRHTCDLVERNETILIIDFYHRGIGTAACGPDCPPHHVRGGGNYSGTIYLRG